MTEKIVIWLDPKVDVDRGFTPAGEHRRSASDQIDACRGLGDTAEFSHESPDALSASEISHGLPRN